MKPRRHVIAVGELRTDEAAELGPLLARTAAIVDELVQPEQVYVGLWSHAGRTRVHIHFVVQPATTEAIDAIGAYGPGLVAGMFDRGSCPIRPRSTRSLISPGPRSVPCEARPSASGAVMPGAVRDHGGGRFRAAAGRSGCIAVGPSSVADCARISWGFG